MLRECSKDALRAHSRLWHSSCGGVASRDQRQGHRRSEERAGACQLRGKVLVGKEENGGSLVGTKRKQASKPNS